MPIASVSKLLGHRTLTMTQRYASLYEQTVKEQFVAAVAHIEGIFAPAWPKSQTNELLTMPFLEHSVDSV
jgi:hypothetical protein